MILPSVRQIPSHNERDLLLVQFLHSDLKRVGFTLKVNEHWSVHTGKEENTKMLAIMTFIADRVQAWFE